MNGGGLTEQLQTLQEQLIYLGPEGVVVATLLALVVYNAFRRGRPTPAYGWLLLVGSAMALVALAWGPKPDASLAFSKLLVIDAHGRYARGIALLGLLFTAVWSLMDRTQKYPRQAEYYILLLGLALGAMFLGSSTHLLMVYLGLETLSLSAYLATHLREDGRAAEASFKYLLFGAITSAFLLYAFSWLYGLTGTLYPLSAEFWAALVALPLAAQVVLAVGTTLGIAFKISAAPGHLWAPDVYETAPLPLVAFFSVVPKVAAATLLLRLGLFLGEGALANPYWTALWPLLIGITLLIGNLGALRQTKAMRLMAYSSIAHSGFLLLAVLPVALAGPQAFRMYGIVYLLMNFTAFGLIQRLHQATGSDVLAHWQGRGKHLPALAIMFVVVLIALVGLPPTAGFIAKLFALSAVFSITGRALGNWTMVAGVIGLFSTVVALVYYLKIPYFLFFKKSESFVSETYRFSYRDVIVSLLTILLVIGFFRSDLMLRAIQSLIQ